MRRTRIVCTIGPASRSPRMLRRLARAGMDVARLNFSHGTYQEHARTIRELRRIGGVSVLQDLGGPKIRIGLLEGGRAKLVAGRGVRLLARDVPGNAETIGVAYPTFVRRLRRGDLVTLGDGAIQLEVKRVGKSGADCTIVAGGIVTSRKGISVCGRSLDLPVLTAKDHRDLQFGKEHGVDLVAASFVRSASDVRRVKRLAGRPVIAKIERREALSEREAIVSEADGIMIARGDLGVEIPLQCVAIEQKRWIEEANARAVPAITATQVLASMVENVRPTRAEVADVTNAVLDGTDAVMLSEETAVGRHPVEAVRMLAMILEASDPHVRPRGGLSVQGTSGRIAEAAVRLASEVKARAIVVPTEGGSSARRIAACRPSCRILAFTRAPEVARSLGLVWGLEIHRMPKSPTLSLPEVLRAAARRVRGKVVVTAGWPFRERGHTNLALVTTV